MYCIGTVTSELSCHMKRVYKQTRFDVEKDAWPPEQIKDFTPVVLVHYEEQRIMKHANIIAETVHTGHISDVISAASDQLVTKCHKLDSHQPLREALQSSKVTKDVTDILLSFDQCNDPQTILIEGAPGIGKTMLMKHIAYKWAKGEVMKKFQLLLLIYLRDPGVQKMTSLKELSHFFLKYTDVDGDCKLTLQKDGGKSLAVLLDGYDEFPTDLRENSLIADIVDRQVLPECGLIISSRPHASRHLHNKTTLRVDILGFTETEREIFIQQSLKKQPQKIQKLTGYLHSHTTISSLCFTPFNMLVLLFLFKQEYPLPSNSTELYSLFICLTINRHLAKSGSTVLQSSTDICSLPDPCGKVIQQLSKLSLNALNDNQLMFTLEQIKLFCPFLEDTPEAVNGFGLLQVVEHVGIFNTTKVFNFIHFSIQEYLAAHYVANLPPDEEHSILKQYFWSDIHYNMFNYYVALTKGQHPTFKQFLRVAISVDEKFFIKDKLRYLRLYRILHEAEASESKELCSNIEEKFADKISLAGTLSPNNLEDLATLLINSSHRNWKTFDLNSCYIHDYGFQLIFRNLQHANITIDTLHLHNNGLSSCSDSSLSDIIITCKVKHLSISGNKNVGETSHFFTTILSHPLSVMRSMLLEYGDYSSTRWAVELFSSMKENKTMTVLWATDNNISDEVCGVICEALAVNNTLETLYLLGTKLSREASKLIVTALEDNNKLRCLALPSFPYGTFTMQQDVVNMKRKSRGCNVELTVMY